MIFSLLFGKNKRNKQPTTYVVSYPRSGHHAMIGFLSRISNLDEDYCEYYKCEKHNGQAIPCPKSKMHWRLKKGSCGAGKRLLKNHDFDLKLSYNKLDKYIIQYRHPFLSIQSWFELESKKVTYDWETFFNEKLDFWIAFIEKWVLAHKNSNNVLFVPHHSLKQTSTIEKIISFVGSDVKPHENFTPNFKSGRKLTENIDFLRLKENDLFPLLEKIGIEPLFHDNELQKGQQAPPVPKGGD